ncbi:hypothetical protein SAMN05428970_3100 [Agromyces sp. CF514]|uniref:hypothetical protein n=1 Tax=Agromyces sp. CF514 TaxID=1881031 RepID=UPI0008E19D69|nr:hypothetical protein [Agromyces sp. CF514]SFR85019.1 hypothetical protein SAMN05428970_3100 [Agromyces sp. CF514]
MVNRLGRVAFGGIVVALVLALGACAARPSGAEAHDEVADAVRDASPEIADVVVEDGVDGLSRYLFVELDMAGDILPADALTAALGAVGATVPEQYETVRVVARTASGDRLELEEPMQQTGVDGVFMINPRLASVQAAALRGLDG